MADEAGDSWMAKLPWVLLGRRTAYQQELGATSAELVLGTAPMIPGTLIGNRFWIGKWFEPNGMFSEFIHI